ncbi:MAG: ATP synthase F1 subunit gamma [Candidatus Moranbacteria bacterium]|nr:ATP synthase F1 subunit gamma [Candidatus Moranbacteria bacterium]
MPNVADIRRRIKGVKSTGKITRAMEMVSAAKVRRAMQSATALRPYAEEALSVLRQVRLAFPGNNHPLLETREMNRRIILLVSGNRGLAGTFYAQLFRKLRAYFSDLSGETVFVTVGKKSDAQAKRMGKDVLASFPDVLAMPTAESVRPIAKLLLDEFRSGRTDRIEVVYTNFFSMLRQEPVIRTILPISSEESEAEFEVTGRKPEEGKYAIEPGPDAVLESMVPRLLEAEIYHAILESNASQEAARMMAMRSATDAAKEMTESLTLAYNQLRQSKITQEIAELSAGKTALEG